LPFYKKCQPLEDLTSRDGEFTIFSLPAFGSVDFAAGLGPPPPPKKFRMSGMISADNGATGSGFSYGCKSMEAGKMRKGMVARL
jgi:hypothetical protein